MWSRWTYLPGTGTRIKLQENTLERSRVEQGRVVPLDRGRKHVSFTTHLQLTNHIEVTPRTKLSEKVKQGEGQQ